MECEFCKNKFNSKYVLSNHQKRAKYCLNIQNKNVNNFICEYCGIDFTSKQNLNKHAIICKEKKVWRRI